MNRKAKYIFIAAHLLVFLLLTFSPSKPKPFGDGQYHPESVAISEGIRSGDLSPVLALYQAPGPSLFYSVPYLFVPSGSPEPAYWRAGFVFNILLIVSCSIFFLNSVARAYTPFTAYITGALMLVFPIHIYYSYALAAECLAAGATLLLMGYTLRLQPGVGWWQQRRIAIPLLLSVTLLVLSRPNVVLVYPVFFGLAGLLFVFRRQAFVDHVRPLLVPFALSFALGFFALKVVSVKQVQDHNVRSQSENLFYVIHQGHFQYRYEPLDWRFWESEIRADSYDYQDWVRSKDSLHRDSRATGRSMEALYKDFVVKDKLAHPFYVSQQFVMRVLSGQFFQITKLQPRDLTTAPISKNIKYFSMVFVLNIVNIFIFIFAFVTLFRMKKEEYLRLLPIFSVGVALFLFHGMTYMETRYLMPTRFLFIMLAALALAPRIAKYLSSRYTQLQSSRI